MDLVTPHVMSPRALLTVFALLLALTGLTVWAAEVLSGPWEVWASIAIASVKATLVGLYFMHLRYDKPLYGLLLVGAIGCLALFVALTLADVSAYQVDVKR